MGNTPDVRVRLSAEGELSIVNAFKRIQAQADQTGKLGSRGLNILSTSALNLGRLLPGLSFAAAIAGAGYLAKQAITTGDQFAKLSQRTGISVETLSTYARGAELAGVDTDELAKGLARLSKNMALAAQGGALQGTPLLAAFERVGITQKELQSGTISLDEALGRISARLSILPDGWQKSAEAQALFGRTGDRLIPFLDKAPAGLAAMREEAQRLGEVWTTQDALAAEQFENNLKRLQGTVQGFVNHELAAILPLLNNLATSLLDAATNADKLGGSLGQRMALAVGTGAAALRAAAGTGNEPGFLARFLKNLSFGAALPAAGIIASSNDFAENFKKEMAKVEEIIYGGRGAGAAGSKPPPLKIQPPIIDEAARTRAINAAKQLANAELALQRAQLESELALYQAHNNLLEADDKDRFKEGQVTVEAYFRGREQSLEEEVAKELAILDQEVANIQARIREAETQPLAKGEPPATRGAEVAKLQTDLVKAQTEADARALKAAGDHAALIREERDELRTINQEQLASEARILELRGERVAADQKDIDAQIAGIKRIAGESDAAFATRKDQMRQGLEAQATFQELEGSARVATSQLERDRLDVQQLVERGIITEYDGQLRIAALEKERLPELRAIAEAMKVAAITPEQIELAQQFSEQIKQLAASSDLAGHRIAEFKAALDSALTSGLSEFFARGIDDAKSLGDAFRLLAMTVVQALRQIVAQMLATLIVQNLLKAVLGGIGGAAGGGGGEFAIAGATGGLVRGPGTSTSDSIPARLSDYEYVVRAAAVREPGNLEILDAMNNFRSYADLQPRKMGRVRNFAAGGLVETGDPTKGKGSRADLNIGLDSELVLKRLSASSDWGRILVRTVQENRRSINAALGRG